MCARVRAHIGVRVLRALNAFVEATIEEHGKGDKLVVFKKKPKKRQQRWRGHRSLLSTVRINAIHLPPELEAQVAAAEAEAQSVQAAASGAGLGSEPPRE